MRVYCKPTLDEFGKACRDAHPGTKLLLANALVELARRNDGKPLLQVFPSALEDREAWTKFYLDVPREAIEFIKAANAEIAIADEKDEFENEQSYK